MRGGERCFVVRCYVLQGSSSNTDHTATALGHYPDYVKPILVGYLNVNLYQTEGRDSDKALAVIMVVGWME